MRWMLIAENWTPSTSSHSSVHYREKGSMFTLPTTPMFTLPTTPTPQVVNGLQHSAVQAFTAHIKY